MPRIAPVIPLPAKPGPEVHCPDLTPELPDLTPELWASIWPLVLEDWAQRMTSAGVAAMLEASAP